MFPAEGLGGVQAEERSKACRQPALRIPENDLMEVGSQVSIGSITHLVGVQRTTIGFGLAGVCEEKMREPVHVFLPKQDQDVAKSHLKIASVLRSVAEK